VSDLCHGCNILSDASVVDYIAPKAKSV